MKKPEHVLHAMTCQNNRILSFYIVSVCGRHRELLNTHHSHKGVPAECAKGLETAKTFPSLKVTLLAMSATSAHQAQIRLGQLTKDFSAAETLTFQYSSKTSRSTSERQS